MISNLIVSEWIVEELVRLGVNQFIISPGSRSTPLTVAIARHSRAKTIVHYDERGAAFYALGYAKATRVPAVLVCTSGTAVANYFPAVIEASMDNIPLIILSADRPPELIDVGANQAIFQENIYGVYPRLSRNLPPPDDQSSFEALMKVVDELYDHATGDRPGPVHLNCQFREPLLPQDDSDQTTLPVNQKWLDSSARFTPGNNNILPADTKTLDSIHEKLQQAQTGLIVVGRSLESAYNSEIIEFTHSLGWPILPDVQSELRFTQDGHIVNHYDLALLSAELKNMKPEMVIHFGGAFTSKRLLQYLNDPEIFYISIKETPERIDPNHQVNLSLQMRIGKFCQTLKPKNRDQSSNWLTSWQQAEGNCSNNISQIMSQMSGLTEPMISYQLSNLIPDDHNLMLANSMSIREMEMFGSAGHFKGHVVANRGSSGIDGLLATAAGYQKGSQAPLTLLIGDLAFLHDLNSLQLVQRSDFPIIIVVINNNGGGIFNFLPVRSETDIFEPFFGTPHGLSLKSAADLFGLSYSNPDKLTDFVASYHEASKASQSTLIEITTERDDNQRLHQEIFRQLSEI